MTENNTLKKLYFSATGINQDRFSLSLLECDKEKIDIFTRTTVESSRYILNDNIFEMIFRNSDLVNFHILMEYCKIYKKKPIPSNFHNTETLKTEEKISIPRQSLVNLKNITANDNHPNSVHILTEKEYSTNEFVDFISFLLNFKKLEPSLKLLETTLNLLSKTDICEELDKFSKNILKRDSLMSSKNFAYVFNSFKIKENMNNKLCYEMLKAVKKQINKHIKEDNKEKINQLSNNLRTFFEIAEQLILNDYKCLKLMASLINEEKIPFIEKERIKIKEKIEIHLQKFEFSKTFKEPKSNQRIKI